MHIRGVAFDLEGTIVDLEKYHFETFVRAAGDLGMKLTVEEIFEKIPLAIGGGEQLIATGIERLSEGKAEASEVLTRKRFYYENLILTLPKIAPRQGFREVFDWIKEQGYGCAIASLTVRRQAEVLLSRSGLNQLFDRNHIVLLEDVRERKPAPDVYLETARRLGISPEEQLTFEDSPAGVKAACAAGSVVVAMPIYTSVQNLAEIIQLGAIRIFADWREMNVAALIANLNQA